MLYIPPNAGAVAARRAVQGDFSRSHGQQMLEQHASRLKMRSCGLMMTFVSATMEQVILVAALRSGIDAMMMIKDPCLESAL